MKIHQLPNGAKFEFEGDVYVKTGPMLATGKGGQRLIPKYVVLKPLGEPAVSPETMRRDSLARSDVLAAFDSFYAECKALLPEGQQTAIDAARERFLKALD